MAVDRVATEYIETGVSFADTANRLILLDIQKRYVYQSDRETELEKFRPAKASHSNEAPLNAENKAFLASLLPPVGFSSSTEKTLQVVNQLHAFMPSMRVIPVWVDPAWEDGTGLVCNGFACSNQIQRLINLNARNLSKRMVDAIGGDAFGRDEAQMWSLRAVLLMDGYEVKYDKTFEIWRITSTNAPTVKAP